MIGTILDRKYRIVELIGSGGMAQVYKAVNMSNRRTVAVKILKDEFRDDAEFLRRFSREANAILTLSHENIVRAYDAGTHDGLPYLVMEYVEGHTLKDLISKNGALPVRTAIGITCQILDALSAAHAHGIIHRDVKPQNVIVTDKGRVKLADFGIAREVKATTMTFSGQKVLGSVHYISPEQAKGTVTTEQSDLYSVGVCLYEMLTGTVPFDSDSTVTVALMHLQDKPVPPIERVPDLPPALNDIVLKALEKEPENRYKTARAMRSDLVRSLSDPNGTFVGEPEEKKQKPRRKPSVYVLIALCVFLPIALIGIVVLIYATSCRKDLPADNEAVETEVFPETVPPTPDRSPETETDSYSMRNIPNLVGYPLDDALRILYREYGFMQITVVYTEQAYADCRHNSVAEISVFTPEEAFLFKAAASAPELFPAFLPAPSEPAAEVSSGASLTPVPNGDGSETIAAETPAAPIEEIIPVVTAVPTEYGVQDVSVTPTPHPTPVPDLSEQQYSTGTMIRLYVYRRSPWSYKADVSYTLTAPEIDTSTFLVEIGLETNNTEEIPYRVILYTHTRKKEAKSEINETATVYWYDAVTRNLNLYLNGEDLEMPQSVTFKK